MRVTGRWTMLSEGRDVAMEEGRLLLSFLRGQSQACGVGGAGSSAEDKGRAVCPFCLPRNSLEIQG